MTLLLKLSQLIDWLNERVGKGAFWLVLIMTVISAGNASYRFIFNDSSNGLLEIQWYLFSGVFLLCAAYTLQKNEHVRIDVISSRFSARGLAVIDIIGTIFFLLPMVVTVLWLSLPLVAESYRINEYSANAGGLIRWPVKILLPIGFTLLALQGISELIKRIAFLAGRIEDPNAKVKAPTPEEQLAADLLAAANKAKEGK
ncbi:MAG: sugar transporter [Betaproteobacteria bacterium HGW-Betaproteobacteria-7]|nr:MAG: sugar transporter [Betaproteobacteria bacterium HGW-Betaproteobacteria-7]